MPNNVKRGYKKPMKKATNQIQKALALAEKRRKQAQAGYRKPPKGKDRVPQYPSRDTREIDRSPTESSHSESLLTRRDLLSAGPMMIPGVALTGAAGSVAATSGAFTSEKRKKPTPPSNQSNVEQLFEKGGPLSAFKPKQYPTDFRDKEYGSRGGTTIFVDAPVVQGSVRHGSHPKMWARSRKGDVEVVVEHSEYICDMRAAASESFPTTATQYQFPANPGSDNLFPWLSTLAQNFDEYKFDYLELHYEPIVGTNVPGKFVAVFDPDVLDEFPDTKQHMLEAKVQIDESVWLRNQKLRVPKQLLNEWLFVRPGAVPSGADQHVYDCGVFNLALPGAAGQGTVGEVFVSYKCRLRTPNGGVTRESKYTVTGVTLAAPMGTALTPTAQSNIGLTWVSGTTFKFQSPGVYYLQIVDIGTGFAGFAALSVPAGSATALLDVNTGAATTYCTGQIVNVTDTSGAYTLAAPSGAATLTSRTIRVFDHDLDN